MNSHLLMITFRVWCLEIVLSGFNYFLLMNRVYAPRVGELRAHRIGMTTRMGYIFPFADFLVRFAHVHSAPQFLLAGTYWLLMILAFEWIGSFILRRPLHEILEAWHVEKGYMWPYVLLAYLLSPLVVGLVLNAAEQGQAAQRSG